MPTAPRKLPKVLAVVFAVLAITRLLQIALETPPDADTRAWWNVAAFRILAVVFIVPIGIASWRIAKSDYR
jgi:hypothetical protein